MVTVPRSVEKWLLCGVLVAGLLPRLYHLRAPLLDNHSYRQTLTAMQSWLYYVERNSLLLPKTVSGRGGTTNLPEFPLYSYIVALFYHLTGVNEIWGRIVGILFALWAVILFFQLSRKFFPARLSLLSALLFSLCPLFVFYSRCFMRQGGFSMFLAVGMLYWFTEFVDRGDRRSMAWAAAAGALALAVNPPNAYLVIPMAVYLTGRRGPRGFLAPRLWALGGIVAVAVAAWFLYHMHVLNAGQLPKTFAPGVATFRNWSSPAYYVQWVDRRFFGALAVFLGRCSLSPLGVLFAAAGVACLMREKGSGARLFLAWLAAAFLYAAVDSYPFFVVLHEYYFLAFVPPLALMFARGLDACVSLIPRFRGSALCRGAVIALVVGLSLRAAAGEVLARFYPVNWHLWHFLGTVGRSVPEGELLFTDCWGPEVLYYSRRYGWWKGRLGKDGAAGRAAVDRMRRLREREGLRYVAFTDIGGEYDAVVSDFLAGHERIALYESPEIRHTYALYRLR
ncbi:MAG: glycosyltransferase family 39 protein [bacterium]|nr:glycosyltransferase family 39 protein [bacterium]